MIKRKLKICKGECKAEKIIFSKGFCQDCWKKEKIKIKKHKPTSNGGGFLRNTKWGLPNKGNKNKGVYPTNRVQKKKTGELKIFIEIYEERPHACQVCGVSLPVFDHWNYAHCLSKGSFNKFRLLKENIILMCRDCHTQYDCGSTINDPKFQWVLELKQKLKQLYYEKNSNI